jgi:hypothetical protein
MADQPTGKPAAPGKGPQLGYGKIDSAKSRDIMTEVGKSKGQRNNSGDFGNGEDGATGATGEDKLERAVKELPTREREATRASTGPDAGKKYPA